MSKALEKLRRIASSCLDLSREFEKGVDKLSFAATTATEAVLAVRKYVIVIKGVDFRAVDNELREFIY